ncbi:MAG: hypothetical protein B6244_09575 [Candidatus Cloacimonetes bacterium 4572_55]|nr:MAG: hypothetical protein B6244_09575 [Candidatus Cloacimonetes bacterium 4572_55]
MLFHLILAPIVVSLMMIGWFLVMQYVRKNSPDIPDNCDVLEMRPGGCHACSHAGKSCPSSSENIS